MKYKFEKVIYTNDNHEEREGTDCTVYVDYDEYMEMTLERDREIYEFLAEH